MKKLTQIWLFTLAIVFQLNAQSIGTIKGTIMSSDQLPIPSVNITIKSIQKSTVTDLDGNFTLYDVPIGSQELIISHIGFTKQKVNISVLHNGITEIPNLILEPSEEVLSELVVSGSSFNSPTSASKSEIPIMDLPQSVTSLSQQTLENQQILTLTDILKNTNGVYIMGNTGGYQEEIAARGFNMGSSNTFKNGVRYFNGMSIETNGLEKVEVLKGSAAILYGNVSAGGIINLVTKKPRFDFGGSVGLTVGSFNFYKPTFDIYGGIGKQKRSAFRINGAYTSANSFRKFVKSESIYLSPCYLLNISEKTKLLVEADYSQGSKTPDFGSGIVDYKIVDLPRNQFLGVKWGYYDATQLSTTATLTHQFNNIWTLSFINSFRHYDTDLFTNARPNSSGGLVSDDGQWKRNLQRTAVSDNYFLEQLDLKGTLNLGSVSNKLLVGADFEKYETKNTRFVGLTAENNNGQNYYDEINIFQPTYDNFSNNIPDLDKNTLTTSPVTRFGVYAQDLVQFNPYIKALLGLRYTYQNTDNEVYSFSDNSETVNNSIDKALSPRLGLILQPTKQNTFFVSYANSFDTNSGVDINGKSLKPSIIDQYEIGIKNELFRGKVFANATYYIINNSNLAQISLFNGNTDSNIKELTGSVQSKGVEIDLSANLHSGLTLMAGYSFNETKYTQSNTYIVGDLLRYNPRHTANFSVNYSFENGKLSGLSLGLISTYFGERYAGRNTRISVENDSRKLIPLSDYYLQDATIAYRFKKMNISGKVANVFNALNYNVHDDNSVNPISPRNYTVTLKYLL